MKDQQKRLRAARKKLGVNTEGLAGLLGVSLSTMRARLLPETSKAYRNMGKADELLLNRILADKKAEVGKRR